MSTFPITSAHYDPDGGIIIHMLEEIGDGSSVTHIDTVADESDPRWLEALALAGGEPPPEPAPEPLDHLQKRLIRQINAIAGEVRSRFITVIPGQEMLYIQKEQEALRWLSDPEADISGFPLIAAEVGITGADADQVAQVYANLGGIFRAIAAQIESARLGAVAVIETASDPATIEAAYAAYLTAMNGFPT